MIFSSLGRSPGRTIVLPPASALASAASLVLAKSLTLKFFQEMIYISQEMIYISFQLSIRSCTIDVFILLYMMIY